jgi:hypothetical protein
MERKRAEPAPHKIEGGSMITKEDIAKVLQKRVTVIDWDEDLNDICGIPATMIGVLSDEILDIIKDVIGGKP